MTCAVKILSFMARYLLKRRTSQNDLKRSKNDLKPSKTTKNNVKTYVTYQKYLS